MSHGENILHPTEKLCAGQWLRSSNGLFRAVMQSDSNFVVYRGDSKHALDGTNCALWSWYGELNWDNGELNKDDESYGIMQEDNNFVIYPKEGKSALWSTHTAPNYLDKKIPKGCHLYLSDDGDLMISKDGKFHWHSKYKDTPEWDKASIDRLEYNLGESKCHDTGSPGQSITETGVNGTNTTQSVTATLSYTETISHEFSVSSSIKIGAEVSGKAGIPFVAEGEVKVSTEVSTTLTWNTTESSSKSKTMTVPVNVEPHKSVVVKAVWQDTKISAPFTATGDIAFKGFKDHKVPFHFDGVYKGIGTFDVNVEWAYANEKAQQLEWHPLGKYNVLKDTFIAV